MKNGIVALAILLLVVAAQLVSAQTAYRLPFASVGNSIELSIANAAFLPLSKVTVEAEAAPGWIRFEETRQTLQLLKADQELPLLFTFSVDKTAPVGKEESITFRIMSSTGENWTKEIRVSVTPPERFELFHNYPNPFNPTTTIGYQLPADSRVSLNIFNILGQEVVTLVDDNRSAGYHEERWDAGGYVSGMSTKGGYASGVYVYQLSFSDEKGVRRVSRKAMMLLK